jgi:hypothetical protein
VHQRILKFRQEQKKKREETLTSKQAKELADIEAAYEAELKQFNDEWEDKMQKYKAKCQEDEDQLNQRQLNEKETTTKNLEDSIPIIPKHSSEFLNLKRIQETLVRNKEYKEAHAIQQKMIELEEIEKLTWGDDRQAKIQQNLTALAKRQENEINSFRQKAKNGFDELKKQKAAKLESLLKKYQNLRKEIKIAHKLEKNRLDGKHTTGSGIFKSDITMSSRAIFSPKVNNAAEEGEANESPKEAPVVEA